MGEGALPGGVFRKSAPGEFEINIPGIAESPVNKIIRRAYTGKQKGEPNKLSRDPRTDKLYPRGFTPPQDFVVDSNNPGFPQIPVERGVFPNMDNSTELPLSERYLRLQEAPLRFFDSPSVQFRHLLEYQDTSSKRYVSNPIVDGSDGNRPGITYDFNAFTGNLSGSEIQGAPATPTYLASFVRTHRENEDPTLHGFDFHVRISNSPIFNGSLQKFLEKEGENNVELRNRLPILREFQSQFFNFFKAYDPNHLSENLPSVGFFNPNVDSPALSTSIAGNLQSGQITNKLLKNREGFESDPALPDDPSKDMRDTFLGSAAKAYYVQSISGLNKLNEQNDYGEAGQRFVKWGSDFLTITVNEDVSQNMGYLAALYKNLAWSRERGRLAVPENLLRFEAVLDITEIRNYIRAYKNKLESTPDDPEVLSGGNNFDWIQIADQTSKYRYFVHECQFFFPTMPHTDTLTNAPTEFAKGLEIKIYFKNSNLRFMKFTPPYNAKVNDNDYSGYLQRYRTNTVSSTDDYYRVRVVDNSIAFSDRQVGDDLITRGVADEVKTIFDNGHVEPSSRNTSPITYPVEIFKDISERQKDNVNQNTGLSDEERRRQINERPSFADKLKVGAKDTFKNIAKAALGRGINLLNLQLISVASLINRTLNQIYNSTPVIGGIKPPKNLYERPNEFEQAYIDFIGPGLRTFYQDPFKFRKEGQAGETLEERISRGRQQNPNPKPGRSLEDYFQLSNQAQPTNSNKTLKTLVEEDVDFGNGFSGTSMIPFLGNSADQTTGNKTTQQKVNENPQFGKAFAGSDSGSFFSFVPEQGNSAQFQRGKPKTLSQIVDNDPSLGNGSGISKIPFLGNRARTTSNNLSLDEIVESDPNLGKGSKLLKGYFSTNPELGNNATTGGNLNLNNLILDNSIVTTLGAFEWDNIQFPSSAQRLPEPTTSGIQNLNQVVDQYSGLQNSGLGNSAEIGNNDNLQTILNSNSQTQNPFLGNSGEIGDNVSNNLTVLINTKVSDADEGNSAVTGENIQNDLLVQTNTTVMDADEGNSAITGTSLPNDQVVLGNSLVMDADGGNSAITGDNIENSELVSTKSKVKNPSLGNRGLLGVNISNEKLVRNESDVVNPSLGNKGLVGSNISNEKLVRNESEVVNQSLGNNGETSQNSKLSSIVSERSNLTNPSLGNRGTFGDNNTLNEVIEDKSLRDNPGLGNSGELRGNVPKDVIIDSNSRVINPELGNSGRLGVNPKIDIKVGGNSKVSDTEIGNSGRFGKNTDLATKINKNSGVDDKNLGNSGSLGYNFPKDDTIENYSGLNNPQIGNSGLSGNNLRNDLKIDNSSLVNNSDYGNGASPGKSRTTNEIVDKQSKVDNSEIANSGLRGKNLNLNEFSKYSTSRVYGTVDWNNIQFPKSGNKYPPPTTEK